MHKFEVTYRHDNPAYVRPAYVHEGVKAPATLMPAEGDVVDIDQVLAVDQDDAEEQVSQLHWNDQDFHILSVEDKGEFSA